MSIGNGARRWAALGATAALVACGGGEASEAGVEAAPSERRLVSVEVDTVAGAAFTEVVEIVGIVEARRDVTVAAEEGGVVRALYRDRGARVRAGEPIAKIDDALLAAQLDQAEAEAALARETWERRRQLWEEEQIGTELAYLQARYAAERAAAQARLLAERVERTTVRAPVAGLVEARPVEVGAMVAPGTPVARVVDIARVKVAGGVPERYAGEVRPGARAVVRVDALGGRVFEGEIAFVGATVAEADRTFPIEIVTPNPEGALKPGMVATVRIERRTLEEALAIPQQAVVRTEDGYVVYVAAERDGETVAEARPVELGASRDGRIVVASGLEAGERVVVVGQRRLAPGDRLRVVPRSGGVRP